MRNTWQLPGRSASARAVAVATAAALVWAVVAIPLTIFLAVRTPTPPPPGLRSLTPAEMAAVRAAGDTLSNDAVTYTFAAETPAARFTVTENVSVAAGAATGTVVAHGQRGDLLVVGDKTYLRGTSALWSVVGVPTGFGGWVLIGDKLGAITFPAAKVAQRLGEAPADQVRIDEERSTGDLTAVVVRGDKPGGGDIDLLLGPSGPTRIIAGGFDAELGSDDSHFDPVAFESERKSLAGAATLTGTSSALTVTEPIPAAPKPSDKPGDKSGDSDKSGDEDGDSDSDQKADMRKGGSGSLAAGDKADAAAGSSPSLSAGDKSDLRPYDGLGEN